MSENLKQATDHLDEAYKYLLEFLKEDTAEYKDLYVSKIEGILKRLGSIRRELD